LRGFFGSAKACSPSSGRVSCEGEQIDADQGDFALGLIDREQPGRARDIDGEEAAHALPAQTAYAVGQGLNWPQPASPAETADSLTTFGSPAPAPH
jgi:hypothetical protein